MERNHVENELRADRDALEAVVPQGVAHVANGVGGQALAHLIVLVDKGEDGVGRDDGGPFRVGAGARGDDFLGGGLLHGGSSNGFFYSCV